MRGDHLDAASLEPLVESVAVVRHITDETLRRVGEEHLVKERFDEGYFMRRSTFDAYGDRNTSAVCDCHDLGTVVICIYKSFHFIAAGFTRSNDRRQRRPLHGLTRPNSPGIVQDYAPHCDHGRAMCRTIGTSRFVPTDEGHRS